MCNSSRPVRGHVEHRHVAVAVGSFVAGALLAISSALAQYAYDPAAADEQTPGIRYFGSVKDGRGGFIPGATILLDNAQASFVFVTDEQGRFRGTLPLEAVPSTVTPKCWKTGFQFFRVDVRPGPQGPTRTVQVDCVLRSAKSV